MPRRRRPADRPAGVDVTQCDLDRLTAVVVDPERPRARVEVLGRVHNGTSVMSTAGTTVVVVVDEVVDDVGWTTPVRSSQLRS